MSDPSFRMEVQDVFAIRGRGTVVTGEIESGRVCKGDVLEFLGAQGRREVEVAGVEIFHKRMRCAEAGQAVGLLFRQISKGEFQRGDVLNGF